MKIDKGQQLFLEGDLAHNIFYIHSGIMQINQETESGKELTVRICGDNSIIGESMLFCDDKFQSFAARAMTPTILFALSKPRLEQMLTEQAGAMVEYMKWLQIENLKHQTRLRDLVLHGKKGALFSTLIRLSNTYSEVQANGDVYITLPLTNSEIANLCGTSREMINRMLNDLKKHHILSFDKGHITIHNLEILKTAIDCDACPNCVCRID